MTALALAVLAMFAVHAAAADAPPADGGAVRPPLLRDVGLDPHLGASLPRGLTFRDEDGATVPLARYFDGRRPVVLSLVYYGCPMLCSQVTNALEHTLRALPFDVGDQFPVLTVSFDPRDGPEAARAKKADALAAYGREAAGVWHFLTGDAPSIRALTDAVGFRFAWDAAGKQFAHVAAIVVLTPDGRIARYLSGIEYPPRDVRLALVEASAGRIGTTVDRLLLFCYHYDATTGRYTAVIERVVQAGGALTVVALAVLMATLRRPGASKRHVG